MNMEQKIDSCPKALFSVMDALKKKKNYWADGR